MMLAHFGKRSLECLLLHRYSGSMPLASSGSISLLYMTECFTYVHYSGRVAAGSHTCSRLSKRNWCQGGLPVQHSTST